MTSTGDSVSLFRLINPNGAVLEVIDYGGRVVRILVPDKNGNLEDVVPGYENINDFESGNQRFFGALIGRYANRIAGGKFSMDGVEYQLTCNNIPNGHPCHLHGGEIGFDRVMWDAEPFQQNDTVGVRFTRVSPDGEEGYPGNLNCEVTYFWTPDNTWRIEYRATTDKPTIVNMSQHCFFNLKGEAGGTILDNYLTIYADSMTPGNEGYTVTGEIVSVENTPYDYRTPRRIIDQVVQPRDSMKILGGSSVNWVMANVNWVLNNQSGQLAKAAFLYEPQSGRTIEVKTTEPGLLIYTGQGLSDKIIGKKGKPLSKYGGLILETIHYPDSPNNPHFPSCVLRPGEEYLSVTKYRFGIK
ncbi:galactose mutarotase [Paludibacter sp.]